MSQNEVIHTSSTGGQKAGNDIRASLIPGDEWMEVAQLFGKGAKKYDDNNWRKGYNWSLSHDALHRHLAEWWAGREFDDGEGGTGQEHLDCVIFHALVLKWFRKHRPQFDDRYKEPEKSPFAEPDRIVEAGLEMLSPNAQEAVVQTGCATTEFPVKTERLDQQWQRAYIWTSSSLEYHWLRNGRKGDGWYFRDASTWVWSGENERPGSQGPFERLP